MKLCVVLLVLAASVLSSEAIINGVNIQDAPYFARIQYSVSQGVGETTGGGAIISHRHVLTSGFVIVTDFQVVQVFVGGITRATQRPILVERRIHRQDFVINPRTNDIGILVLAQDLSFDRFVQPIALPVLATQAPLTSEQGTVYGFGGFPGQINSLNLQAAFMRVTDVARCNTRVPGPNNTQQFCGEDMRFRTDFCALDLGGPFVVSSRGTEVLVGIASLQVCHTNPQVPSQPSLFTRVSAYRQWIFDVIQI